MPSLSHLELFSNLTPESLESAERLSTLCHYNSNDVVISQGNLGEGLYVVLAGTLYLKPEKVGKAPSVFLGPGEAFGELSLLSANVVSVSIIAFSSAEVCLVPAEIFHRLFAEEPAFRHRIAQLLARRLRVRTSLSRAAPICVFVALPPVHSELLPKTLLIALDRYVRVHSKSRVVLSHSEIVSSKMEIQAWRASNDEDAFVLFIPHAQLLEYRGLIRGGDGVLLIESAGRAKGLLEELSKLMNVDVAVARIGDAVHRDAEPDEPWSHIIEQRDLEAEATGSSQGQNATEIDRIARWMARRSIGLALGAGGARGFAHLGVLEVIEGAGIPIDFLAGSSIGGILALLYGLTGCTIRAREMALSTIGSMKLIRDVSWIPSAALFSGRKVRRQAERIGSGILLRDLKRSSLAVAADLVSGRRFILDTGPLTTALVATAAIPGIFPPVKQKDRVLVDGALTSLVPVDLLTNKRCGLKIAINVQPDSAVHQQNQSGQLMRALCAKVSIVSVITRSWDLLGSTHGTSECEDADILLKPIVSGRSGFDFDAFDYFLNQGRECALKSIDVIKQEVTRLLARRS